VSSEDASCAYLEDAAGFDALRVLTHVKRVGILDFFAGLPSRSAGK